MANFGYRSRVRGIAILVAAAGLGLAHLVHGAAEQLRGAESTAQPYVPSPGAAPFVAAGYREVAADLFWVRLTGYFGDEHSSAQGVAALVETITTLDPKFHRVYEWGARAMTIAPGVDQAIFLRAIAVLERGAREYPGDWRIPNLAGQIYTQDLVTSDPRQRRAWDERGTVLVESAMRKPNAPAEAANWAATMWSKLGQHQRAIDGLREMLLVTEDDKARASLVAKLAQLDHADADTLAVELFEAKAEAAAAWKREHPAVPFTMFVLLGARPSPTIDLAELATGGFLTVGDRAEVERLPPVE